MGIGGSVSRPGRKGGGLAAPSALAVSALGRLAATPRPMRVAPPPSSFPPPSATHHIPNPSTYISHHPPCRPLPRTRRSSTSRWARCVTPLIFRREGRRGGGGRRWESAPPTPSQQLTASSTPPQMVYANLGNSGLKVSKFSIGGWLTAGGTVFGACFAVGWLPCGRPDPAPPSERKATPSSRRSRSRSRTASTSSSEWAPFILRLTQSTQTLGDRRR